jgi:hypothetical protein
MADTPGALQGRNPRQIPAFDDREHNLLFFFSNRLGCVGSLVISAIATLILLFILGVL